MNVKKWLDNLDPQVGLHQKTAIGGQQLELHVGHEGNTGYRGRKILTKKQGTLKGPR